MIFQIPGIITKIQSLANSWRIQIDTQDESTFVDPDSISKLAKIKNQIGWFTFNSHLIDEQDIVDLPPLRKAPEERKTPSQRMRDVLYRMWERDNEGYKVFEDYYRAKMEMVIEHWKQKYLT